jgi:hypothetical protein
MGGDSSVTIIWACLAFLWTIIISQGFDSTTTSAATIAVSSGYGVNNCIVIIDIESKRVMTTIPMAVRDRTI